MKKFHRIISLFIICILLTQTSNAQFLMDMVDTSKALGKGLLNIYKNFNQLHIGGYMQPQYQLASEKGAKSYIGGDFVTNSNNRFMLRRGRLRFDYIRYTNENLPFLQIVYQFDGTERGVFIRDFWGRIFDQKWKLFSFTTGMFARPFGYELNLSSSDRESPERGRMSQILMKTERDLGVMASFEPRKQQNALHYFKLDAGFFNGQGLAATTDYDSYKDFIARASLKPYPIADNIHLSAGVSLLQGGLFQNTKFLYTTHTNAAGYKLYIVDSSQENLGRKLARKYYGADVQLKINESFGATELRAEYWHGKQPGSASTSETPAILLNEPYYLRNYNGAFFYLLQNIVNSHHQLGVKLDWYDPNADVAATDIGKQATNFTAADIKYTTLGFGYLYYINENLKLVLWYDHVKNEQTQLEGFTNDVKDDILTCRLQFRF